MRGWLGALGFLIAAVGCLGWALIIRSGPAMIEFALIAVGALVCAGASLMGRMRLLPALGWAVAAVGGLFLLIDQLRNPFTADFPAPLLFDLCAPVAACGAFIATRSARRGTGLVIAGAALGAASGIWWTVLDIAHASYDYTWANASIGLGYALTTWSLARPR